MFGIDRTTPRRCYGLGQIRIALFVSFAGFAHVIFAAEERAFVPEPHAKGYGIRAVPGATLKEMIANCAAAQPSDDAATQLKWEECAQLHRSLKTQPGNTAIRR